MSDELGVFTNVDDAIDAAYQAQKILIRDYSTDDRDRFIKAIQAAFLEIVEDETRAEFEETGYGRLDQKIIKNIGTISEAETTASVKSNVMTSSKGVTVEFYAPYGRRPDPGHQRPGDRGLQHHDDAGCRQFHHL